MPHFFLDFDIWYLFKFLSVVRVKNSLPLVTLHKELHATIEPVDCKPAIKQTIIKSNVFVSTRIYTPSLALLFIQVPATEQIMDGKMSSAASAPSVPVSSQYRARCKKCKTQDKFNHKTRFYCSVCSDPMYLTHGLEQKNTFATIAPCK